jgi:SAM-dependent methyltransferase
MKLRDIISNPRYNTDKDTSHSYIEVYDEIFEPYQNQHVDLLEIGNNGGGSIKLWLDYFDSCNIFGMEINRLKELEDLNEQYNNVNILMGVDAYRMDSVVSMGRRGQFDIIIDDGSHLLMHQIFFINSYKELLKPGGVLVIEDVQSINWLSTLLENIQLTPEYRLKIYDRRNIKDRYDDIIIVITKGERS